MKDWKVFQTDVLDLLRQYQGFFDFFERIGSLRDNSRPDAFARITREEKKEVWVIDAKNKSSIDTDDLDRMNKYVSMAHKDPIDIGLELSEVSEYDFRGIFITPNGKCNIDNYEQINFSQLHQFLQKELIYTDTDKIIRDIAKMAEREQLSHSEARLLFRSMKPFERRINRGLEELERLEKKYTGLKLMKPPVDSFEFNVPVDAILLHEEREKAFLIDIPYSEDWLEKVEEKVDEVKKRMQGLEMELYYAALDVEGNSTGKHIYSLEEIESEIRETASIISPEEVAEMFSPKISVNKEYFNGGIRLESKQGLKFRLEVRTVNDFEYRVKVWLPSKVAQQIKDNSMNARKKLGEVKNNCFEHTFTITDEAQISYQDNTESLKSYRDTVRSIYSSALNPVLSKKVRNLV